MYNFFTLFFRSIIITSNTYGEDQTYINRQRSDTTLMSEEKLRDDFLDSQPDTSRRPTVAALNVRFFAEKPHVAIEVMGISPTSL